MDFRVKYKRKKSQIPTDELLRVCSCRGGQSEASGGKSRVGEQVRRRKGAEQTTVTADEALWDKQRRWPRRNQRADPDGGRCVSLGPSTVLLMARGGRGVRRGATSTMCFIKGQCIRSVHTGTKTCINTPLKSKGVLGDGR